MKRGSMFHNRSRSQVEMPIHKKIYYYKNTSLDEFITEPATLDEINKKIKSIYSQIETVGKKCEERLHETEREYEVLLEKERIELDREISNHLDKMEELLNEYKQRNEINYTGIYKSLTKEVFQLQKEFELSNIKIKKHLNKVKEYEEDIEFISKEINYSKDVKKFLQNKIDVLIGSPSRNNNNNTINTGRIVNHHEDKDKLYIHNLPKVIIPNRFTTNISNIQSVSNNNVNNSSINYVESISSVRVPSAIKKRQLNQSQSTQGGLLITKLNEVNTNPKSMKKSSLSKSSSVGKLNVINKQEHKVEILEQHFIVLENKYKKLLVNENKSLKKNEKKYFQLKAATKNKLYNVLKSIIMSDLKTIAHNKSEDANINSIRQSSLGSLSTINISTSFSVNHLSKNEKKDIAIRFFENKDIKKIIYDCLYCD